MTTRRATRSIIAARQRLKNSFSPLSMSLSYHFTISVKAFLKKRFLSSDGIHIKGQWKCL